MSLYIGKDNSLNNILHITKDTQTKELMKTGYIPNSTIFLSSRAFLEVVYTLTIPMPTATTSVYGVTSLSSPLKEYINNTNVFVFAYVVDNNNFAYELLHSEAVIEQFITGEPRLANLSVSNNGKNCLFIVVSNTALGGGSVSISNQDIVIGGVGLLTKNYLVFNNSSPVYNGVYYNTYGSGYLGVTGFEPGTTLVLENDKILYKKSGLLYHLISSTLSSKIHNPINHTSIGSITTFSPYDGQFVRAVLPSVDNSSTYSTVSVRVPISFYYSEGWSGGGSISSFTFSFTLRSSQSVELGFSLTPFLGFVINWNKDTKTIHYGTHRYTDQVETYYTGVSSPAIVYDII